MGHGVIDLVSFFWCRFVGLFVCPPTVVPSPSLRCLLQGAEEEEEGEGAQDQVVDVVSGVATDVSSAQDGGEEGDEEQQERAFAKDLERERAGTTFSKAKELEEQDEESGSSGSEEEEDEEDGEGDSSSDEEDGEEEEETAPAPAAEEKQTEEQEHHEMSRVRDDDETGVLLLCGVGALLQLVVVVGVRLNRGSWFGSPFRFMLLPLA